MQELMKKSLTGSRCQSHQRSDDMEYISKDKTLKKLQMQLLNLEADQDKGEYSELCENRGARDALDEAIYDIRAIKGEDVQPVVRCKDCKYAQNPNDTMVYCTYFECGTMSQDDFCSQGDRRTENG